MKIIEYLLQSVATHAVPHPSTLEYMEAEQFPYICVPFYSKNILVKVRKLSSLQIQACGEFSLIGKLAENKKVTLHEFLEYAQIQEKVCRIALVSPTYEAIIEMVKKGAGKTIEDAKKEMIQLESLLLVETDQKKREKLKEDITQSEIFISLLLPPEFMVAVFMFSIGLDKSNIKQITDDMLIKAAYLAEKGNDNPADHLKDSTLTDFNIEDINVRAWYLLRQEKARINGR